MNGKYFILFTIILLTAITSLQAQTLSVNNGWYYIDGEKFFIKGVGYEMNSRPGRIPWEDRMSDSLFRYDMARIKDAGFNTLRTWSALPENNLQIIEEFGLKVIMGIWIDPQGNFCDFTFRSSALDDVNNVLSYSKNYDCIIGYLIMNEPLADDINSGTASGLKTLWQDAVNAIHTGHPGVPVSFSNSPAGDYLSTALFDFTACNLYIYNPVQVNYTLGYTGYVEFLKNSRSAGKPLVISEFGLSVSPGTPLSGYTYGFNTEEQQTTGCLEMYRSLIDGGAQGGCIFQYHDGWWKAGNETAHDDDPEEWFGLIEFSGLDDSIGTPRPVWDAIKEYNSIIITEPKNGAIYQDSISIELFPDSRAVSFSVLKNGITLSSGSLAGSYYYERINWGSADVADDVELYFSFLNSSGDTVKTERIIVMHTPTGVDLPDISVSVDPAELQPGGTNTIEVTGSAGEIFNTDLVSLDYGFHPHIGFDPGTSSWTEINNSGSWNFSESFSVPSAVLAATFSAGYNIYYGKFVKRIYSQVILTNGTWAEPVEDLTGIDISTNDAFSVSKYNLGNNYPNPFNSSTTFSYTLAETGSYSLSLYSITGELVRVLESGYRDAGTYRYTVRTDNLASGVYFYNLSVSAPGTGKFNLTNKMIYLK